MKGTIKTIKFKEENQYGKKYDITLEGDDTSYFASSGKGYSITVEPGDEVTYEVSTKKGTGEEIRGENEHGKWCAIWKVQKVKEEATSQAHSTTGDYRIPNATEIAKIAAEMSWMAVCGPGAPVADAQGNPIDRIGLTCATFEVNLEKVTEQVLNTAKKL